MVPATSLRSPSSASNFNKRIPTLPRTDYGQLPAWDGPFKSQQWPVINDSFPAFTLILICEYNELNFRMQKLMPFVLSNHRCDVSSDCIREMHRSKRTKSMNRPVLHSASMRVSVAWCALTVAAVGILSSHSSPTSDDVIAFSESVAGSERQGEMGLKI
jgi:hypothetical protein